MEFCLLCPLFTCSTTFSVGEVTCLLSQSTSKAAPSGQPLLGRSPHAHFAEPPASKVPNNLQNPLKFIAITCVAHQGTGSKKSVPSSNHTNSYRGHSGVLQSTSQLPSTASAVSSHPPAGSWPASVSPPVFRHPLSCHSEFPVFEAAFTTGGDLQISLGSDRNSPDVPGRLYPQTCSKDKLKPCTMAFSAAFF